MLRLILGRLAAGVVVVLAVATFSFFMLRAAPGGPFDDERSLPESIKRNIEKRYHLDKDIFTQYALYMQGLFRLDLGYSLKRPQSVSEIISEHWAPSVYLGVMSLGFAAFFGVLLGVLAAARHNSAADHAAMSVALLGISMPSFVLAPILIMIFSIQLGWLPPARFQGFSSMILPSLTLGLIYMGVVARLSRSGLLETMRQDYIRTARAKGLSEGKVVWKHAVRLGLVPVVTYLGPATAALITGSFVVEQIFQIPGLGFYFVASISDRDYPVLTGVLVFYSVFLIMLNLLVDIAYGLIDPRIRDQR
jgi:ABC-type dipeptide/oligopeptide/nickel transport system permease component